MILLAINNDTFEFVLTCVQNTVGLIYPGYNGVEVQLFMLPITYILYIFHDYVMHVRNFCLKLSVIYIFCCILWLPFLCRPVNWLYGVLYEVHRVQCIYAVRRVWDVHNAAEVNKLEFPSSVADIELSSDGKLLTVAYSNKVAFWSVDTWVCCTSYSVSLLPLSSS